jgi:hypothetical protein
MLQGGILIHIIGKFLEPSQVGGLVDTLKNSGIQRRDMIISAYDEEKFEGMRENANQPTPVIMSDQDDVGELKAFAQNVQKLDEEDGIVVSVKVAKKKAPEVKSVMEQSGAFEIVVDDNK